MRGGSLRAVETEMGLPARALTDARVQALWVLWEAEGHAARESNVTAHGSAGADPTVYWQTRAWLEGAGFVARQAKAGWYRLTPAGLRLARLLSWPAGGNPGRPE